MRATTSDRIEGIVTKEDLDAVAESLNAAALLTTVAEFYAVPAP